MKENPEKDAKIQDFTYTAHLGTNPNPQSFEAGFDWVFFAEVFCWEEPRNFACLQLQWITFKKVHSCS